MVIKKERKSPRMQNRTCILTHEAIQSQFTGMQNTITNALEFLTLQNIPASCLFFPSGLGPRSACSQTHPYKTSTLTHPSSVSNPADTTSEKITSHTVLSHSSLVLQREEARGLSRLTGCLLTQQHSLQCKSPITEASSA